MRTLRLIIFMGLLLGAALPAVAQQTSPSQDSTSSSSTQQSSQAQSQSLTLDQIYKAIAVGPELFDRALTSANDGDLKRALLDTSTFLLLNPTASEAYAIRAQIYQQMGDNDLALRDLGYALDYTATSPDSTVRIYLARANIYVNQNQLDLAMNDLNASLDLVPESPAPRLLRARIERFQGDFSAASDDYDTLIQQNPNESSYYVERGDLSMAQNNQDAALQDFDSAIALNPQADDAYAMRALIKSSTNKLADALSDINHAIDINPQSSQYYLMRGAINAQDQNVKGSAEDYFQWIMRNLTEFHEASNTLTQSGTFTVPMADGQVFGIPFQASAGQQVSLSARHAPSDTTVDPLLVVLDVNGDPIVADDDSGGNMDALILGYKIPEDGEYTLLVGHAASGGQGNITVIVDLGDN